MKPRNILFIMYDQLRFDYMSCAGHRTLQTPHFDSLASKGVRFSRAYCQSPICGSSRMSFYTGRYVSSHGAQWNNYPLKAGELTLGDHLRDAGTSCWLVGKTHMRADTAGLARLGIDSDGIIGTRIAQCGFDIHARDDGLWGRGPDGAYDDKASPYNEYLKRQGYPGTNPWADFANAGIDADGHMASGWFLANSHLPANIREADSETPWLTREAMSFIDARVADKPDAPPWLCHVSYIKPHWPYIVPAPYHDMYTPADMQAPQRSELERQNPHPVLGGFMNNRIGQQFRRDDVREKVIPAYMGLVKQCDDQLGVLLRHLEDSGEADRTVIVITSDHGDYLGDHWLGEKDMFHEPSVRVPLIVFDPTAEADASRGTVCDELVESIDLTATFIEMAGGHVPAHIVEGRSLMPFLRGEAPCEWREFAISEYDYAPTPVAQSIGVEPSDARLFMVADKRYKFTHCEGGLPPILFDLEADPYEYRDVGDDPEYAAVVDLMMARLGHWARRMSQRTTRSDADIAAGRGGSDRKGILLGVWDGSEVDDDVAAPLRAPALARYVVS